MGELLLGVGDLVFTLLIGYMGAIEFLYVVRHLYHHTFLHPDDDKAEVEDLKELQDNIRNKLKHADAREAAAGTPVMQDGIPYKDGFRLEPQNEDEPKDLAKELARQKQIEKDILAQLKVAEEELQLQRQLEAEAAENAKLLQAAEREKELQQRLEEENKAAEEQQRIKSEFEREQEVAERKRRDEEKEAEEIARKLVEAERQRENEQKEAEETALKLLEMERQRENEQKEAEENAQKLLEWERQLEEEQKEAEENAQKLLELERQREKEQKEAEENMQQLLDAEIEKERKIKEIELVKDEEKMEARLSQENHSVIKGIEDLLQQQVEVENKRMADQIRGILDSKSEKERRKLKEENARRFLEAEQEMVNLQNQQDMESIRKNPQLQNQQKSIEEELCVKKTVKPLYDIEKEAKSENAQNNAETWHDSDTSINKDNEKDVAAITYNTSEPNLKSKAQHLRHRRSPAKDGSSYSRSNSLKGSLEMLGEDSTDPWGDVIPEHYKETDFWKREKAMSIDEEEIELERPLSEAQAKYEIKEPASGDSQSNEDETQYDHGGDGKGEENAVALNRNESEGNYPASQENSPNRLSSSPRLRRSPRIEEIDTYEERWKETTDTKANATKTPATPTITIEKSTDDGPWRDEHGLIMEGLSDFYDFTASVNPSRSRSVSRTTSRATSPAKSNSPKNVSNKILYGDDENTLVTCDDTNFHKPNSKESIKNTDDLRCPTSNLENPADNGPWRDEHGLIIEGLSDFYDFTASVNPSRSPAVSRNASRTTSPIPSDAPKNVSNYKVDDKCGESLTIYDDTNSIRSISKEDVMSFLSNNDEAFAMLGPGDKNCEKGFPVEKLKLVADNFEEQNCGLDSIPKIVVDPCDGRDSLEKVEEIEKEIALRARRSRSRCRSPSPIPTTENIERSLIQRRNKLIQHNEEIFHKIKGQSPDSFDHQNSAGDFELNTESVLELKIPDSGRSCQSESSNLVDETQQNPTISMECFEANASGHSSMNDKCDDDDMSSLIQSLRVDRMRSRSRSKTPIPTPANIAKSLKAREAKRTQLNDELFEQLILKSKTPEPEVEIQYVYEIVKDDSVSKETEKMMDSLPGRSRSRTPSRSTSPKANRECTRNIAIAEEVPHTAAICEGLSDYYETEDFFPWKVTTDSEEIEVRIEENLSGKVKQDGGLQQLHRENANFRRSQSPSPTSSEHKETTFNERKNQQQNIDELSFSKNQLKELRKDAAEFRRSRSRSRSLSVERKQQGLQDAFFAEVPNALYGTFNFSEHFDERRASDSVLMQRAGIVFQFQDSEYLYDMEPDDYHHLRRFSINQEQFPEDYTDEDFCCVSKLQQQSFNRNGDETLPFDLVDSLGYRNEENLSNNELHEIEHDYDSDGSEDERRTVVEVEDEIEEDISDTNERGRAEESQHEQSECEEADMEFDRYADKSADDWKDNDDTEMHHGFRYRFEKFDDEGAVGGSQYDSDSFAIDQIYDDAIRNRKQSGILREYDCILQEMRNNAKDSTEQRIKELQLLSYDTSELSARASEAGILSPSSRMTASECSLQFLENERRYLGDATAVARNSIRLRSRYGYVPVLQSQNAEDIDVDLNYCPKREYNWRKNFKLEDDEADSKHESNAEVDQKNASETLGSLSEELEAERFIDEFQGEDAELNSMDSIVSRRNFSLGGESITLFSKSPERVILEEDAQSELQSETLNMNTGLDEQTNEASENCQKLSKKKNKKRNRKGSKDSIKLNMKEEIDSERESSRRSSSITTDWDMKRKSMYLRRSSKDSATNEEYADIFATKSFIGIEDAKTLAADTNSSATNLKKKNKKRKKARDNFAQVSHIEPARQNSITEANTKEKEIANDVANEVVEETDSIASDKSLNCIKKAVAGSAEIITAASSLIENFDILKDGNLYPLF